MTQTVNRTGFEQTNYGLYISKDIEAQLVYTFDWSEWLDAGDTVVDVDYEVAARRNDPTPIVNENSGITPDGTKTFIEISGGQVDKTYVINCKVTTANGFVDRRNFQMKVEDRSA
jgi:hypothetical protein